MTDDEFLGEVAKGNFKRIGAIDGTGQHGTELQVLCDDWEPAIGDMLRVRGLIAQVWPNGREIDVSLVVTSVQNCDGRRRTIGIHPPIIPSGHYENTICLANDGATLYQPAGELLREIWKSWLATNH